MKEECKLLQIIATLIWEDLTFIALHRREEL